ncbi:MAG: polar amino acid transport system substrate-binding protein [Phenylobacterium sp.]|jgi:polar amino acid transport system substrate-binding protein
MKCHKLSLRLLMLLSCCLPIQAIQAEQYPLRIVTENMPPYNYQDQNGELVGPSTEVVNALLKTLGLSVAIEVHPWARAYKEATSAPNVMIYSIIKHPERVADFHWLSPIGPIDLQVFSAPGSGLDELDDLDHIGDHSFGILRKSSLMSFIKNHHINHSNRDINHSHHQCDKQLLIGKSYEHLYKMHQKGRIDLFMAPGFLVRHLNHKFKIPPQLQPKSIYTFPSNEQRKLYLAFSKATPASTVLRFETALQQLHKNGRVAQIFDHFNAGLSTQSVNKTLISHLK